MVDVVENEWPFDMHAVRIILDRSCGNEIDCKGRVPDFECWRDPGLSGFRISGRLKDRDMP